MTAVSTCEQCHNRGWRHVTPGGDDGRAWIGPCDHVIGSTNADAARNAQRDGYEVGWAIAFMDDPTTRRQCAVRAWPFLLAHDLTDDHYLDHEPDLHETVQLYLDEIKDNDA